MVKDLDDDDEWKENAAEPEFGMEVSNGWWRGWKWKWWRLALDGDDGRS